MKAILALNAGSSSLKFAAFGVGPEGPLALQRGRIERRARVDHLTVWDASGAILRDEVAPAAGALTDQSVIGRVIESAEAGLRPHRLAAIGHRIVHGGAAFTGPTRLDEDVRGKLAELVPLAPLHQPQSLAVVEAAIAARPGVLQTASFDTAFHRTMPDVATRLALPRSWHDSGVRRYGFHGLSYDFIAGRLREVDPALAAGRVLVAHLGAGASLCVMEDGRSLDTTMGFTALDGLVMSTRCGALDPGVVLHMLQQKQMSPEEIQDLLYHQSGLLGVSGQTGDMGLLLEGVSMAAHQAVELFIYRIAREAGALMAVAGGLDGLVFTGGIGENEPAIREAVAKRLAWMGAKLDAEANAAGQGAISAPDSALRLWVLPTDEEQVIARDAMAVLDAPVQLRGVRPEPRRARKSSLQPASSAS